MIGIQCRILGDSPPGGLDHHGADHPVATEYFFAMGDILATVMAHRYQTERAGERAFIREPVEVAYLGEQDDREVYADAGHCHQPAQ